ncbi:hypothetical protein ACXNAL_20650 [Kluyvera ascorbata]|uniref:hypothetical protein n=1 Tax=Kluyvera ascorbata TaxID=51288 RepID=UPI0022E07404|nr:hypothetical protein [Kluyvera ascorbata]
MWRFIKISAVIMGVISLPITFLAGFRADRLDGCDHTTAALVAIIASTIFAVVVTLFIVPLVFSKKRLIDPSTGKEESLIIVVEFKLKMVAAIIISILIHLSTVFRYLPMLR